MPRDLGRLTVGQAALLGALHGPAELLPVSSSGHVAVVPVLLGWDEHARLDGEVRKAFEVALHAGTAAALAWLWRDDARAALRDAPRTALTALPAALAGLAFERPIERRLGTPRGVAFGMAAGGALLAAADLRAARAGGTGAEWRLVRRMAGLDATRRAGEVREALEVGCAQACALVPGLSRSGMVLAAARARGRTREEAAAISRRAALPVIGGATALKGVRLARRGLPPGTLAAFAAGTAASFAATLAAAPLARPDRPLWPFALYRGALAAAVLRRVRQTPGR